MEKFTFRNYGGSYQLKIQSSEDFEKILSLDEALWAATSIPIDILNCDKAFLHYLDTDKNGRIRTDEIKNAVRWFLKILKNYENIGKDILKLESINIEEPEGNLIRKTAERILKNTGIPESKEISLSRVRDLQKIMADAGANGDGVITPDTAKEPEVSQLISLIMSSVGSVQDKSGKPGINQEILEEFFNQAKGYIEWINEGKIPEGEEKTEIMVYGKQTEEIFKIMKEVEEKIDNYFLLCGLAKIDERVIEHAKLKQKELEETTFEEKQILFEKLNRLPLAPVNKEEILNFDKEINILYREKIEKLKSVLEKIYGEEISSLTKERWENFKNSLGKYREWLKRKKGEKVESIGEEKLKKYIEGNYKEKIEELIRKDLEVAEEIRNIQTLEKLILYQRYLLDFLNNSVSFSNVYDPTVKSLYEAGTLIIDGRKITLTIKVTNRNIHKKISQKSNVFLMYLLITGKEDKEKKFEVVAALTSGEVGRLGIGKRGVFFTNDGKEWDAEIVDMIVNPVGLLEAIKSPFIRLAENIKRQVEKFAKAKQKKVETAVVSPTGSGIARDLMVGGGVAIAAIGSSFAYITKVFSQVKFIHILITVGVIGTLILIPSMIVGFIKLRRRDLSIIFEASGCAINLRMRLTTRLGGIFTFKPPFPKGSKKEKGDILKKFFKQTQKVFSWKRFLIILLIGIFLFLCFLFFVYKTTAPQSI
ncbi:hypothetical protein J7L87_00180 [bacterium]|nr:hypothetical protein [bacterium]